MPINEYSLHKVAAIIKFWVPLKVMTNICRDSVMRALARIDPCGSRERRRNKLTRRQYISKVRLLPTINKQH